jgi:hypothetical protein
MDDMGGVWVSPPSPCPIYLWSVKHGGLKRRFFCVRIVAILNSREIPCAKKKRRFWLVFPDTAMKSGYCGKNMDFSRGVRSPRV